MNIYQNIYDLIHTYIFGGDALTANTELITILLSSVGCVFVFSLPFLLIYKVLKML